jgi:hypothetical protein
MNEWPFSGQPRENRTGGSNVKRELYGKVLMVAIAALFAVWVPIAYTAMTGLTLIAAPSALWAQMMRKRKRD